jgi:cell division protein FtsB
MGWLTKQADPVSARARDLNQEIAALEQQISRLNSQIEKPAGQPRLRSTALPRGVVTRHPPVTVFGTTPAPEPVFEEVKMDRLKANAESVAAPEQFNELGVRKYDLAGLFGRVKNQFFGPSTNNPRLVTYLAAGGVQGLRPMRYEKRVARNRLLLLVAGLFVLLLGILSVFIKNH